MSTEATDVPREFHAPRTMTAAELGDHLARLVWESFSDFVEEGGPALLLEGSAGGGAGTLDDLRAAEEALIFFMWAHTRGTRLAFTGRAREDLVRAGLDAMRQAVLSDLVQQGTPASRLNAFEKRVGTRYEEYEQAVQSSEVGLGRSVVRRITGAPRPPAAAVDVMVERALVVSHPLRDFLEEVELVP